MKPASLRPAHWTIMIVLFAVVLTVVIIFTASVREEAQRPLGSNPIQGVDPILHELIQYGALAPSSHNAQMWKVKVVSSREFIILMDRDRLLPQVDPNNREAFISLGAFIENIVAAAPAHNLRADVAVSTQRDSGDEIAKITLLEAAGNMEDAAPHIRERHTIRTPFLKTALEPDHVSALISVAKNGEVQYFSLSTTQGEYIRSAIIDAVRRQTDNDKKQAELADYMRFSKKDAESKRDGITPAMMGLSGIQKWFVQTFFTRKTTMSDSFRKQTVDAAKMQAENCAGYFVLAGPDDSIEALINAGRLLERFWLKATALRVAVHPMSAPLEEEPWKTEIGHRLGIEGKVQMVLRVGNVEDYGHPVSQRREVPIIVGN